MTGAASGRSLAEIGRAAAKAAQREALLETLEACGWCLSEAAKALGLGVGTGNVIRSIKTLGLTEDYEAARHGGLIVRGRHHACGLTHDQVGATVPLMVTNSGGNQ